jgi:hypothetical protein
VWPIYADGCEKQLLGGRTMYTIERQVQVRAADAFYDYWLGAIVRNGWSGLLRVQA